MRRLAPLAALLLLGLLAAALLVPKGSKGSAGSEPSPGTGAASPSPVASASEIPRPALAERPEPPARSREIAPGFFVEVHGRVVDSTGTGVGDARVAGGFASEPETVARIATGSDGSFRLDVPVLDTSRGTAAELSLLAGAEGFAPTLLHGIRPRWNRTVEVGAIALLRPGVVEGTVRKPGGEPASGAEAGVVPQGAWGSIAPALGWLPLRARADEAGRFRLEGAPPGLLRVTASLPGYLDGARDGLTLAEGNVASDLVLTLREGAYVSGRVLDPAGGPAAGAEVRLAQSGSQGPTRTVADASGEWRLGPRPPGEKGTLVATTERAASAPVPAATGESGVVLRLVPRAHLAGRVLSSSDGRPIPNASIRLEKPRDMPARKRESAPRPGQPSSPVAHAPQFADAAGAFSHHLSEGGWFRVLARAPGFAPGRSEWVLAEGSASPSPVEIRLPLEKRLRGRILGPDGEAVPLAEVLANGPPGPDATTVRARGQDGAFEVGELRAGNYRLTALVPGYEEGRKDVLVPEAGDAPPVEVRVRPASGLAGRVTVAGAPPAGAVAVFARGSPNAAAAMAFAGADGRFEIVPLPPGPYRVEARPLPPERRSSSRWQAHAQDLFPPRPDARSLEVTVPEGGLAEVFLDVSSAMPPRIRGTVRRSGRPAEGVEIRAQRKKPATADLQRSARTSVDGAYEMWLPVDGTFEVQAREPDAPAAGAVRTVEAAFGYDQEVSFDLVSGEIGGRVVTESGEAVSSPSLRLSWEEIPGGGARGSTRRAETTSGRFLFRGLPAAAYTLALWSEGRGVRVEKVSLGPGEVRDLGVLALPPVVPVTVALRWEDGKPLVEGGIVVEDASGIRLPALERSGAEVPVKNGHAKVGHLGPGEWRLRLNEPVEAVLDLRLAGTEPVSVEWVVRHGKPKAESDEDR